ncbi:DUF6873 family GME fold protein [Clostridium formicaceticum]|uniref:DUF6873 domain-containing protein n=1 Tax=Clostridium formicaceticum TaxID=1497 RepID=A0AAC9RJR0_9CLOT|nr:hypothetical protein [Clostridium formicaceticum]AOY76378.1 hypothetical protein BJL90_10960 [Clostridium formicaceticum]ARE86770.1 hypothetical protein CLFO_11010 [Clostridium formicaceticum]
MEEKYIETPHLPKNTIKCALVDYRIGEKTVKVLEDQGISLIKTVACAELYQAIEGHPDMVIQHLGGRDILIAPNVIQYYQPKFEALGFRVLEGKTYLKGNYPHDIAYNICRIGSHVIHNFKHTDKALLDDLQKRNLVKIHVSQGYSKCSVAVVDKKAMITSDSGIHKEVIKFGIDSLLIAKGGILLPGVNHGFIGGACGYLDQETLGFYGDITSHESFEKIAFFLRKYNKKIKCLNNKKLQDYGTLIPLLEMG